ncbi:MAG: hypothetical protein EB084_08740, partial [Proteobacteria bacterium]|nr:hypothetical protein [Pseudomonadota bacterium]
DALEWMISQPNGEKRMLDLLGQASQPGNTTYMAKALANTAQASPDQTLGLLLLTTDANGGPAQMARLFGAMADKPVAAAQFASTFEALTRTPQSAASMSELLDVVTRASFDDQSGSRVTARLLRESSAPSSGADSILKGLSRTLETEGGARSFARVMSRISTSAADSASFLENLGNRETGSETVGRLMARATASRDGSRQVLDSFVRMAGASGNEKKTGEVVARIISSQSGAKFVSNLTSDPQAARQLETMLSHLDAKSPVVGDRLAYAFDKLMAGPEGNALRARALESPALASVIDRFVDSRAVAPLAAPPEAGADAPANGAAGSPTLTLVQGGLARASSGGEAGPGSPTKKISEASSTAASSDCAVAAPGRAVQPLAKSRESGGQGVQPHVASTAARPSGGQRDTSSDASGEQPSSSPRFRPADVYSQSTLRLARICGDCGFRLTPGGRCVKCDGGSAREAINPMRAISVAAI